jgi:hypothetical protein
MAVKADLMILAVGELLKNNAHQSNELAAIYSEFKNEYGDQLETKLWGRDWSKLRAASKRIADKPKDEPKPAPKAAPAQA